MLKLIDNLCVFQELVREKFTLQSQVNEHLVQISSLRNQLDDMRHRRGIGDIPDTAKTLEFEREKSEEKDKEVSSCNPKHCLIC